MEAALGGVFRFCKGGVAAFGNYPYLQPMKSAFLPLLPALLLASCAAPGTYPSLAPRPYEKAAPQTAPPAPPAVSDAGLIAQVDGAVARAEAGQGAFDAALALADKAVAASDRRRGSESWIAAQMSISRLERTREPIQVALADLDAIMRGLLLGPPSADRAAVEAAMAKMGTMDAAQLNALQRLIRAAGQ